MLFNIKSLECIASNYLIIFECPLYDLFCFLHSWNFHLMLHLRDPKRMSLQLLYN